MHASSVSAEPDDSLKPNTGVICSYPAERQERALFASEAKEVNCKSPMG
jgi:hypothetical protein